MNRIITIGREFGSGGRELGRRLSEKLSFAYYDQEIISEIAEKTSLSEEYIRSIVEKKPIFSYPIHTARTLYPQADPLMHQNLDILTTQHKIIQELAEKSDCVIVGRCADYILRDMEPFRVFVYADSESKEKRTRMKDTEASENAGAAADGSPEGKKHVTDYGVVSSLSDKELKKRMDRIDRERAKYYEFYTGQKWGARVNYDILVNTSKVSPADAAEHLAALFGKSSCCSGK